MNEKEALHFFRSLLVSIAKRNLIQRSVTCVGVSLVYKFWCCFFFIRLHTDEFNTYWTSLFLHWNKCRKLDTKRNKNLGKKTSENNFVPITCFWLLAVCGEMTLFFLALTKQMVYTVFLRLLTLCSPEVCYASLFTLNTVPLFNLLHMHVHYTRPAGTF